MQCYRTRQWTAAIDGFRQVLAMHPGDQPSKVFVERAEYFRANDPGSGWDGVWTMTSK